MSDELSPEMQAFVIKFTQFLQDIRSELRIIHKSLDEIKAAVSDSDD